MKATCCVCGGITWDDELAYCDDCRSKRKESETANNSKDNKRPARFRNTQIKNNVSNYGVK
jgi:hypothetical protein